MDDPWLPDNHTNTTNMSTLMPPQTVSPDLWFEIVPLYTLVLACASSVLSIFGCCGILAVFCKFGDLRTNSKKLLMYLTIADLLTASGNLMGLVRYINRHWKCQCIESDPCTEADVMCKLQSFITTSASLMSFLWMMVISTYFHVSVRTGNTHAVERRLIVCHVVCWLLPLLIVSVAAAFDLLGEDQSLTSGSWCWLTQCPHKYNNSSNLLGPIAWDLLTGKLFEMICYLTLVINYGYVKHILITRLLHRETASPRLPERVVEPPYVPFAGDSTDFMDDSDDDVPVDAESLDPRDAMFIYLPFIMLVLRAWGTLKFLLLWGLGPYHIAKNMMEFERGLTLLQGIGDSAQGWMNFLLFCVLTEEVRGRILSLWRPSRAPSSYREPSSSREPSRSSRASINTARRQNSRSEHETRRNYSSPSEHTPLLGQSGQSSASKGRQLFDRRQEGGFRSLPPLKSQHQNAGPYSM